MAFTYRLGLARSSSAANPISVSYTAEPGDGVMCLLLKTVGATDRAGGAPTWHGHALTQANSTQKAVTSPEAGTEVWYLLSPKPGTGTLTIPNTGAATIFYTVGVGKAGGAKFMGANGGNATSTNPTPGAVTVNDASCIAFASTAGGWTNFSSATPVGIAIGTNDDGAHGAGTQYIINPAVGSHALSWTFGTSDDWGAVSVYFAEIPANSLENYKTFESVSAGVVSVGENMR